MGQSLAPGSVDCSPVAPSTAGSFSKADSYPGLPRGACSSPRGTAGSRAGGGRSLQLVAGAAACDPFPRRYSTILDFTVGVEVVSPDLVLWVLGALMREGNH